MFLGGTERDQWHKMGWLNKKSLKYFTWNQSLKLFERLEIENTAQKMKFSIRDFFSKCQQISSLLRICSHMLKESLMKNLIFRAVNIQHSHLK